MNNNRKTETRWNLLRPLAILLLLACTATLVQGCIVEDGGHHHDWR